MTCRQKVDRLLEDDLPVIIGIANSVLQVVSAATGNGVLAAGVSAIITEATTALTAALNALQTAISAYQAAETGGNLAAVIAALQSAQQSVNGVIAALPTGTVSSTVDTIIVAGLHHSASSHSFPPSA